MGPKYLSRLNLEELMLQASPLNDLAVIDYRMML